MQKLLIIVFILITLNIVLYPKAKGSEQSLYHQANLPQLIEVEILGAVVFPGRYDIYHPKTIEQLISYAGGYLENADLSQINMRTLINRNAQITIPFKTIEAPISHQKINLNQANFKTLYALPYITESIAISILMYREKHGPFWHIEELLNVKHIGPKTFEKIKDYFILG